MDSGDTIVVYVFEQGGIPTSRVLHEGETSRLITDLSFGRVLDELRAEPGIRVRFGNRRTWMPVSDQEVQNAATDPGATPSEAHPHSAPNHWLVIDAPRGGYWKIAHGWEEEATGRTFGWTRLQRGASNAQRADEDVFPLVIHGHDAEEAGLSFTQEAPDTPHVSDSMTEQDASAREERQRVTEERWKRSAAHRREVLRAYGTTCAICGWEAISEDGLIGVEAVHIRPVEYGGEDGSKNGIPLCPNHHWLFDEGVFAFDSDLRVVVNETDVVENEELEKLDGTSIKLPDNSPRPTEENIQWRLDSYNSS